MGPLKRGMFVRNTLTQEVFEITNPNRFGLVTVKDPKGGPSKTVDPSRLTPVAVSPKVVVVPKVAAI